jgi:DNA polymerase-3 subunit beta
LEDLPFENEIQLPHTVLKWLIERTHFAMAQQDVRYYLNGLMIELSGEILRAVATDGHRLAYCEETVTVAAAVERQVIVPRKGVQELLRLLGEEQDDAVIKLGANHIQAHLGNIRFTSKLIDGKFPDYQRVIPRESEHALIADRTVLRTALARTAILSSDKYRGVRLQADAWVLQLQAHNPEQEEAEEEVEVNYDGPALEIGFNVTYLLDALAALTGDNIKLSFTDANSSCLLQEAEEGNCKYVVMPMRL